MKTIDRKSVKEISDKIQALLDELSKKEGIKMEMRGGRFTFDSFTLKLEGKLLTDSGTRYVSDMTNDTADRLARCAGISFTSPHFIGSVWRFEKTGLVRVEECLTKNRRYPYICAVYGEEGRRIKTTSAVFKSATEVPVPTEDTFRLWFTTDVEDDCISPDTEELCDAVNDYVSARYDGSPHIDAFFEYCGAYYDTYIGKKKSIHKDAKLLSSELYDRLILNGDVKGALELLKKTL